MDLRQIIWVSTAVRPFSADELIRLLDHSRAANQGRNISGLLLYHQDSFLQLMEGSAEEVEYVFEHRILRDRRHTDVTVLMRRDVKERNFPDWSMGFVNTTDRKLNTLPGFHEYRETTVGFLQLLGDRKVVSSIITGFHDGRWHQL
jgi:hypothetical protein